MNTEILSYDTSSTSFVDITSDVQGLVDGASGLVNVFAPHATAGVALIETGSGTESDLADTIERLLPRDDRYRHSHGSKGHGADHVLPAFIAPSLTVPVIDGRLALGTWQSIVLVDTNRDNPQRKVRVSFLEG
jgi:secondary thiamine-phosphate synthase enzyme